MDDDDYMADMAAAYTAAELVEDDLIEDDEPDYEEHAYWDDYLADEAQAEYDDEWGDPLDLPSYAD